jgi:hypothetical protein
MHGRRWRPSAADELVLDRRVESGSLLRALVLAVLTLAPIVLWKAAATPTVVARVAAAAARVATFC